MAFIDGTVVNVALPAIQASLGATVVELQWVVEAYALLLASLLLVGGALGDRFGRRRVFSLGVGLFALASGACGLARDPTELIWARAVQGVGGALLVPGSLAILSSVFEGEARGKAIGTWSAASAMAAAVGPVLGGWLVENLSWRWAFFINLPVAAVVFVALARVPESRDEQAPPRLDVAGAGLATLGLGGLVFALLEASSRGWSDSLVRAGLIGGPVALAGFVFLEARRDFAMVPLNLFRDRTFAGTNLLTLLVYGALGGGLFFLPLNLVQVQGYTATAAGAAFLPFIVLLSTLSRWMGGLSARLGARPLLVAGPLVTALGYVLLALLGTQPNYFLHFLPGIFLLGAGMAITVAPLTTAVMASAPQHKSGVASGVNNAVSRTGGLVALAALGILMVGAFNGALDDQLDALDLDESARAELDANRDRLAGTPVPEGMTDQQADAVQAAIHEAFLVGYRWVMLVAAGLCVAGSAAALALVAPRLRPEPAPERQQ